MKTETITSKRKIRDGDANRDPLTGEPGSHPVGTGVGAAAGAATGAALGAAGGPVGMAIGGVAGAVAGGFAGHAVAENIDPTVEDAYWRDNYSRQSYYDREVPYEDYQPAYRTGYEGYSRYGDRSFDEAESDLKRDFERVKGRSRLTWENAKQATHDAWHRVERALPGDADGDGL